jgi:hypothetical protein
VYNAAWCLEFLGDLLKLRCSFGTMGLGLNRSVSEKVPKRTEMPFMKSNWKCQSNKFSTPVLVLFGVFLRHVMLGLLKSLRNYLETEMKLWYYKT